MPYTPVHTVRTRLGNPAATPLLLAATITAASAGAAYVQTRDAAAGSASAATLLAERARAATLTSSRTAARTSLMRALPSSGRYSNVDPTRTPALDASLTTVARTDTRATAKLRARLAEAITEMTATGRAYAAAAGTATARSAELSAHQGRLLTKDPAAATAPAPDEDALRTARTTERTAADAHRAAIAHTMTLRAQVLASAERDRKAALTRENAAIKAGTLIRLKDGSTIRTPEVGTPIKGNGHTLTAPVRSWIAQALTTLYAAGYTPHEDDAINLATIIYNESGGDPAVKNTYDVNALRGMPSFGLMQTIGPTFEAWVLPGHANPADPVHQIMAGARYAEAAYGSLGAVPGVKSLAGGGRYLPY